MKKELLTVKDLTITIAGNQVVNDITFNLKKGETLCLVGESGSGKSLSALAVMGLLPEVATVKAAQLSFEGAELQTMDEESRRKLRGAQMSMIFQEPMTSLNPVIKVGEQVAEVLEIHTNLSKKERRDKVVELFKKVQIKEPERRYSDYPFQMSGGQRQRVMIAMALAMSPKLLIADEPTTALDVTVQGEILDLIKNLQAEMGMAVMFITHDFGVVQEMADHVAVMQFGEIVEQGTVKQVMEKPKHAYTKKLLAAMPKMNPTASTAPIAESDFLTVKNVDKTFMVKEGGFFGQLKPFQALKNINFSMQKGETLGVVGESGCGKSTLSRCITRLYDLDGGEVLFMGDDMVGLHGDALTASRKQMQMIFQDPFSSLNPRMKVGDIVAEGLKAHKVMGKKERTAYVKELLQDCGLPEDAAQRYPHQFSGGQRQRIGIARALALKPALIIADEPVSALDVSVQKQILELMENLKEKYSLSYLFISHDLRVVSEVCDRVLVMRDGEIVEQGAVKDVFTKPKHRYTQQLLDAVPQG